MIDLKPLPHYLGTIVPPLCQMPRRTDRNRGAFRRRVGARIVDLAATGQFQRADNLPHQDLIADDDPHAKDADRFPCRKPSKNSAWPECARITVQNKPALRIRILQP